MPHHSYDIGIVGAGIVGLAHALAAARLGLNVVVLDRDAQANGASIRNFGFVTVTGQEQGDVWRWARRSRDVWAEIAGPADIRIERHGLLMVAQRPEARLVCEAFLRSDMADGCQWLERDAARERLGNVQPRQLEGVLESTIELRVESRSAIPALAAWLTERHGVTFRRGVAVHGVETGNIDTSEGNVRADMIVVCPGDDLATLYPDALVGVTRCKLQMMRLATPGYRLPATIMSDLGLTRYLGYSALPAADALKARLETEQRDHLANGVHLIVTQSADGSLIVGDSHHYAATPDPFSSEIVDQLILEEFRAVFGHVTSVVERWNGTYASAAGHSIVTTPNDRVRLVVVTSGTGASTSFGLAEDVITPLINEKLDTAS